MKKLLLFLLAALGIVGFSGKDLYAFNSSLSGEYIAYVGAETADEVFSVIGEGVFSTADYSAAENAGIIAESIILAADTPTDKILKLIGSLYSFSADVEGVEIIYGYSSMLKHLRIINYRPVNFQITRNENSVTVSTPVNLGSY